MVNIYKGRKFLNYNGKIYHYIGEFAVPSEAYMFIATGDEGNTHPKWLKLATRWMNSLKGKTYKGLYFDVDLGEDDETLLDAVMSDSPAFGLGPCECEIVLVWGYKENEPMKVCPVCKGCGEDPPDSKDICARCSGAGLVMI